MEKNNILLWTVVILAGVLILFLFGSFGTGNPGYSMMGMMYGNYGSGWMFFGWIFNILVLVALGLFIAWLFKQLQKT